MQHLSNFTENGLPLGVDQGMTYLYGISDFFQIMFEDDRIIDLILESGSVSASEIYSRFLQQTTSVSLAEMEIAISTGVKLVLVSTANAVGGSDNKFKVDVPIQSAKYLSNRPFLPTAFLENEVDYEIEQIDESSCYITFSKPITSYPFSSRLLASGAVQYGFWAADCVLDEGLVYKAFGKLIGEARENATENYANFIYGLYFLYMHGPTLGDIRRGMNLILGIPLARGEETVIDVRYYSEPGTYTVITDKNQYLVPYGIAPSVAVDDVLETGQELAQWVELKDYLSDGDWWINLRIPERLIPELPDGQINRYASSGSHLDEIMRKYLKTHTFLVNVKVDKFQNVQLFTQISDVIAKVKPAYTQPIYIWSLASDQEEIPIDDEDLIMQLGFQSCEHTHSDITEFRRDNSDDPSYRGCATFMRWMAPPRVDILCGYGSECGGYSAIIDELYVSGIINPWGAISANSDRDIAWMRTIVNRGCGTWSANRGKLIHNRGLMTTSDYSGVGGDGFERLISLPDGWRVIPLFVTSEGDVARMCSALGYDDPLPADWVVELLGPHSASYAINTIGINRGIASSSGQARAMYSILFFKGDGYGDIDGHNPDFIKDWSWAPPVGDVQDDDYLVAVRTTDKTFGVYWVTSNLTCATPAYVRPASVDELAITITSVPMRGLALNGQTPYYFLRGAGGSAGSTGSSAVNEVAINVGLPTVTITTEYADSLNSGYVASRDPAAPKLIHRIVI